MPHALTQAAMHSHYHRGQNATRLRELGGAPLGTDFIVWLGDGQPAARWDEGSRAPRANRQGA
ncbi:MAG TPA: hypothetical protein VFF64_05310 [Candidatus Eremiobacteraceae bacterium]|nr:hypothetical protein [Candidatus Eremiobacteraceae bacterium]